MLAIEAEGVPGDMSGLESGLAKLLEGEGMHPLAPGVISHKASGGGEASSALLLAMEEGYVHAHYYPAKAHVGLEIVLWSKIAKLDDIRAKVIKALDTPTNAYSSYRVIHGGMLGAKNWKEDVEAVGPVNRNLRECDPEVKAAEPQVGEGPMADDVFATAVTSSLSMLPKKMDKVVAVLCGKEGEDGCKIVKTLRKHS